MLNKHDQVLVNASSRGQQGLEQSGYENYEQEEDLDGEVGSKHTQLSHSCSHPQNSINSVNPSMHGKYRKKLCLPLSH
jgi:hypothetical protein